ncbi:MAG: HEAT repeat domain-containing protein, partial [Planctomycetota bacterium]
MHVTLVLALSLAPLAPRAVAAPLALQNPAPTPADGRPEVKTLCEELGAHAGKRGKEDSEAISVIDKLVQEFANSGPKDRAAIVKQLDKCFTEKRQEDKDGLRENKLFLAAATALGEMKPECVPVYLKWIGEKSHKKDIALQRLLILKLGKTKDEAGRKPLINLLNDENAKIQAAAAEALGEFGEASQEVRKTTFEALLKLLMSNKGQVDSNVNDLIARERYDTIAAPIATALGRLSGQKDLSPEE